MAHREVICLLVAGVVGATLLRRAPFPEEHPLLSLVEVERPVIFYGIKWAYLAMLFTTPFITAAVIASVGYIFIPRRTDGIVISRLPLYPDPLRRDQLSLVIGELHHAKKPDPAESPRWLIIPERGLYTGVIVFGAIGTGKTSGCMFPFAEQILGYRAADPSRRIGGLVLEVKGDFCHKVRRSLKKARARGRLPGGQPGLRRPLQPAPQRPGRLRAGLRHRQSLEQPLRQRPGTVLAAGLHQPGQVRDPAAQGALRLRHALRRLPGRDQPGPTWKPRSRKAKRAETAGCDRHHVRRLHGCPRTGGLPVRTRRRRRPDEGAGSRGPARSSSTARGICYERRSADADARRPRPWTEEKRQQFEAVKRWFYQDWLADRHSACAPRSWKGSRCSSRSLTTTPRSSACSARRRRPTTRSPNADGRYGTAAAAVCAADRTRRGLRAQLPGLGQPRPRAHHRHADEAGFPAGGSEPHPADGSRRRRPPLAGGALSLRRVPRLCHGRRKRSERRREVLRALAPGQMHSGRGHPQHELAALDFAGRILADAAADLPDQDLPDALGRFQRANRQRAVRQRRAAQANYTLSEQGQDAGVSVFTGRAAAHRTAIGTTKGYNVQRDFVFEPKVFAELKNAQAIVLAYDGSNPAPPSYCYLKPYYLDPNISYFEQLAKGATVP